MTEREFQTQLIRGARHEGFHAVPIPDSGMGKRFGVKKVYDLCLGRGGVMHSIELKRNDGQWFRYSDLEHHQIQNLQDAIDKGFPAVVICLWETIAKTNRKHHKTGKVIRETVRQYAGAVSFIDLIKAFRKFGTDQLSFLWWFENSHKLESIRVPAFDKKGVPKFNKSGTRATVKAWSYNEAFSGINFETLSVLGVR